MRLQGNCWATYGREMSSKNERAILGMEHENKKKPKKRLLSPYLLETAFKTPFRSSSTERQGQKAWISWAMTFFFLPDVLLKRTSKEILTQLPYEARLPYPTYDHMAQSTQGRANSSSLEQRYTRVEAGGGKGSYFLQIITFISILIYLKCVISTYYYSPYHISFI